MTTPFFDQLVFGKDEEYQYEISEEIFNPNEYGLNPIEFGSHCRRGFVCFYEVLNNQLYLRHLIVCSENYPKINGVEAQPANPNYQYRGAGCYTFYPPKGYFNLKLKMDFTGTIKAGDFSSTFFPPYNRNNDFDNLVFENGILINIPSKVKNKESFFTFIKKLFKREKK